VTSLLPLRVERDGAVTILTLDRPDVLNAFDERLTEVARHYDAIGGRSPLNAITFAQADALRVALANGGTALPARVARSRRGRIWMTASR